MVHSDGILGLFPAFTDIGGVEYSGRVAWEGIRDGELGKAAYLFCYGCNLAENGEKVRGQAHAIASRFSHSRSTIVASSKPGAIWHTLRRRWPVRLVLVWHLGLMKLLPFLRVPRVKVVLFLHGIEVWRKLPLSLRWLLRRVDLFLANSEHTWRRFVAFNPEFEKRPRRVVPLGVGAPFQGETPAPQDRPVALMLGRMVKSEDYKGHREVIAAWPRVLCRVPDAELWIAGDGDLRPELERMVRERGLEGNVRFWGRVSEQTKQELLIKSRCLAMPSRGEGFGLVYLEAMRLGRPCLVSTLDAGREVVHPPEAGLAADPDDTEALAEAVCRLLTPGEEWDAWSRRARERYERYFTAAHFQKRLLEALGFS